MAQDSVVHAVVEKSTLEAYIETVNSLVTECKLHMSGDGFHVSAVDPSNVGMIDHADLAPRAFEAYDAPGSVTQGINLIRLLDFLGPADSDQLIDLNLNMETRKLEIGYGATSHSMALIDPEAVRKEPDEPDLELPNTVTLEGADLKHAVDVVSLSGTHIYLRGNVDERQVEFFGQGDTDETTVAYGDGDVIDASISDDVESIYSLDLLEDMAEPIPDDAEVTLHFAEEFPVRIFYETEDGALDVKMTLAPRVVRS